MQYGVSLFFTEHSIQPAELSRELEQRGFESLWVSEHTHIPASLESPRRLNLVLDPEYWQCYDPFISLTIASGVTTRLKLGTGVLLLGQRDPIVTAKQVATLDRLSNGRLLLGIGAGWNIEELENHGTEFQTRFQVVRERMLAMKEIWTRAAAEFHGDYVDFESIWLEPKPVQSPHPPVLMGGSSQKALACAAEFCDGWIPTWRPEIWPEIRKKVATLRQRSSKSLEIALLGPPPAPSLLEDLEQDGIDRLVFGLWNATRDQALRRLDEYTRYLA